MSKTSSVWESMRYGAGFFDAAGRELRRIWQKRKKEDGCDQAFRDLVGLFVLQCANSKCVLPEQLALLVRDVLEDPDRKRFDVKSAGAMGLLAEMDRTWAILIAHVAGVRDENAVKFLGAAQMEGEAPDDPRGKNPSSLSGIVLAAHFKVDPKTIKAWRTNYWYKEHVKQVRAIPTVPS